MLDLGMPGMDGYEVARHIRALPGSGDTTLIALTGWGRRAIVSARKRQASTTIWSSPWTSVRCKRCSPR